MQVKPNGNSLIDLAVLSNGHVIVASIDGEVVEVAEDGHVNLLDLFKKIFGFNLYFTF